MNKDEIIALLQQQISFLQEQVCSLQNQLAASNRKADALLEEVTSLRNLLEHKSEEEAKQTQRHASLLRRRNAPVPTTVLSVSSIWKWKS